MKKRVVLQEAIWNFPENIHKHMFYKSRNSEGKDIPLEIRDGQVSVKAGDELSLDTYFNACSSGKWYKYCDISGIRLIIEAVGAFDLRLIQLDEKGVRELENARFEADTEGYAISLDIKNDKNPQTIVYPKIVAEKDCIIKSIRYEADVNVEREIRLAVDICTFKREPYLAANMDRVCDAFYSTSFTPKNPENVPFIPAEVKEDYLPIGENIEIFISDNGKTLGSMFENYPHIHVKENANLGGVGGFTRGIIEAQRLGKKQEHEFTHILIMDDDAITLPCVIAKTYRMLSYLKDKYVAHTVGGGLLRENTTNVQFESGAIWNRGKIVASKHHYDLTDPRMLPANEFIEPTDYTGWWYTVVPMKEIAREGLPLPIFIHRDDIEYGIRTGKGRFILMNGIGVWHEAFENKMPGATEYYDLRNYAILNSIHRVDFSANECKTFLRKWALSNLVRYRYTYVRMNLLGMRDFLKGIDFLKETDGEALHKELLAMNYKMEPASNYIGYRDIKAEDLEWKNLETVHERKIGKFEKLSKIALLNGMYMKGGGIIVTRPHGNIYDLYKKDEVLNVDAAGNSLLLKKDLNEWKKCRKELKETFKLINEEFNMAKKSYEDGYKELTSLEFWKKYLGI